MAKKSTADAPDFENSLQTLEALVEKMETGELSLEQSLQEYERGMSLSKQCQTLLSAAEQRVAILSADNALEDFEATGDE